MTRFLVFAGVIAFGLASMPAVLVAAQSPLERQLTAAAEWGAEVGMTAMAKR